MDGSEPESRGLQLQSRKRKSFKRRSSILKSPSRNALGKIDANTQVDGETTTRMSKSRRVSFADTCQVKEFAKYSPHKQHIDLPIDQGIEVFEGTVEHQTPVQISGLDKLLTGAICNQASPEITEVKELPFPKDQDSSSILSNTSLPEADKAPVKLDISAFLKSLAKKTTPVNTSPCKDAEEEQILSTKQGETQEDFDDDDFLPDCKPGTSSKISVVAFLKKLKKKCTTEPAHGGPILQRSKGELDTQDVFTTSEDDENLYGTDQSEKLDLLTSLKKLIPSPPQQKSFGEVFFPSQQFPDQYNQDLYNVSSKPDFETIINTQLNKFSPSPSSARNKAKSLQFTKASEKSDSVGASSRALNFNSSNQPKHQGLPALQSEHVKSKDVYPSERLIPAEWFTKSTKSMFEMPRLSKNFVPIQEKENIPNLSVSPQKSRVGLSHPLVAVQSTQQIDIHSSGLSQQGEVQDEGTEMEMTACLGNIQVNETNTQLNYKAKNGLADKNTKMAMSISDYNICSETALKKNEPSCDVTRKFSLDELEAGMDMTTCYGNIKVNELLTSGKLALGESSIMSLKRLPEEDAVRQMKRTSYLGNNQFGISTETAEVYMKDLTKKFQNESNGGGDQHIDQFYSTQNNRDDFTKRFDDNDTDAGKEMTKCYGNIDTEITFPNKTTQADQNEKINKDDFTKRFDNNDTEAGMEMTKCYGNIDTEITFPNKTTQADQNEKINKDDFTKRFDNNDIEAGMEITKCYSKIDLSAPTENDKINKDDFTKRFDNNDTKAGMEITKCYGKIDLSTKTENYKINKDDFTKRFDNNDTEAGMEMTKCNGKIDLSTKTENYKINKDDFTKRFDNNDTEAGMEITKCYGKIDLSTKTENYKINKDDFTKRFDNNDTEAGMEITKCYGKIDLSTKTENYKINKDDFPKRFDNDDTEACMEMTKCYGKIDLSTKTENYKINKDDFTKRFDNNDTEAGMEITKCYGKIDLSTKTENDKINKDDFTKRFDSNDKNAGMEITKCYGNKETEITFPNKRTLAEQNDKINRDDFTKRIDSNDTEAGMEMTKRYGNIDTKITFPNKRTQAHQTRYFIDETEAGMELTNGLNKDSAKEILVSKSLKSREVTEKLSSDDKVANMEMTSCYSGIDNENSKHDEGKMPCDSTKRFSSDETEARMDLTACNDNDKLEINDVGKQFLDENSTYNSQGTAFCGVPKNDMDKNSQNLANTYFSENCRNTDFQTLKLSTRKRSLSQSQSIYQPEKVARLLGKSRRSSNLIHLVEKINQLKYGEGKVKPSSQVCVESVYDDDDCLPSKPPSVTALLQSLGGSVDLDDTFYPPTTTHQPQYLEGKNQDRNKLCPPLVHIVQNEGNAEAKAPEGYTKTGRETRCLSSFESVSDREFLIPSQDYTLPLSVRHKNPMDTSESQHKTSSLHYSEPVNQWENNFGNTVSGNGEGIESRSDDSLIDTSQDGVPDFLQNASSDDASPNRSVSLAQSAVPNSQQCEGLVSPCQRVPLITPDGTPLPTNISMLTINVLDEVTFPTSAPIEITLPTVIPADITLPPNMPEDITWSTSKQNDITFPTNVPLDITFSTKKQNDTFPSSVSEDIALSTSKQNVTLQSKVHVSEDPPMPKSNQNDRTLPPNLPKDTTLPIKIPEDITFSTNKQNDITLPNNLPEEITLPLFTPNDLTLPGDITFPTSVIENIPQQRSDAMESKENDKTKEMTNQLKLNNSKGQRKDASLTSGKCGNQLDITADSRSENSPNISQDSQSKSAESFLIQLSGNTVLHTEGEISQNAQCKLPDKTPEQTDTAKSIESNPVSLERSQRHESPYDFADCSMADIGPVPPSSVSQKNMSTMDMTLSQSYIGSQCSISSRRENTSYHNLSIPAVWNFDHLSTIGNLFPLDWSGVGRRSSFAPVQELNEEGILENVLIDSCQVEHIQIASAEMEERTKQLLQKMTELESSIDENQKSQFQEKAQQNRECWAACRKRAKELLKPSRLRWVEGESKALKVNKERITSAASEINGLYEKVEYQKNIINEELKRVTAEINQLDNKPIPSETEILELNKVKEQVLQKTAELKQAEGERKEADREISLGTKEMESLQTEFSTIQLKGDKRSADGQKSEDLLNDIYFKFNARKSLTEWSLVSGSEQTVRFLFLYGCIVLDVEFWRDSALNTDFRQIDLISLKSALTSETCMSTKLAHNLVVKGLTRDFLEQYEDETQLPKLLNSVSEMVWRAKCFEQQFKDIPFRHRSSVSGTSVAVEFLNVTKLQKCSVTFDLSCDLRSAEVHIHPIMGCTDEAAILKAIEAVSPSNSHQYFLSLVSAVDNLVKDGDTNSLWSKSKHLN